MTTASQPTLITVTYASDGKLESLYRIELCGTSGESACDQAREWFHGEDGPAVHIDPNTEVHLAEQEITVSLLRETFTERDELVLNAGRFCALIAIANGAPAIDGELTYKEWAKELDAFTGDYELLAEVAGASAPISHGKEFRDAYLTTLFDVSPCAA